MTAKLSGTDFWAVVERVVSHEAVWKSGLSQATFVLIVDQLARSLDIPGVDEVEFTGKTNVIYEKNAQRFKMTHLLKHPPEK